MASTFYWHDYETWGIDPAVDRPCQFAGQRTDADLNPIGPPLVQYCRPADDCLPHPEACLVTGISPQHALREGLPESDFAAAIQRELALPGTCGVGYNSLHFDDQVTRFLFYRNLLDPYAHTWQSGNSRWDLIEVLRLAHALRPAGLVWPEREPGVTSFRLEDLSAANDIPHGQAHDALADVTATIALARRLQQAQPRLFAYALGLRDQDRVRALLLEQHQPLLHCSQRYPAVRGCIAPVAAVAVHPGQPKQVLCFDLRQDPAMLLDLDLATLRQRLFTPAADLPADQARIPLKGVRLNAAPMLAPMSTLSASAAARWEIDPAQVARHARTWQGQAQAIAAKVQAIYHADDRPAPPASPDPERQLYQGFFPDGDRRQMAHLRALSPAELANAAPRFDDPRLPTLYFRWRARNWPETLSEAEREDWDAWRLERLTDPAAGASLTLDPYAERIAALRQTHADAPAAQHLLDALEAWAEQLMDASG
ncbi:MAG: exodeoxyribonuclease I [Chromatiaceae bacterium]|nr:MAG: exodeoxyribonuclease I [Chromatiaceae bacterium]